MGTFKKRCISHHIADHCSCCGYSRAGPGTSSFDLCRNSIGIFLDNAVNLIYYIFTNTSSQIFYAALSGNNCSTAFTNDAGNFFGTLPSHF